MNKRGQTEVITTILLILIVLAAVIIVWQVINRFVTKGGETVTGKSQCIDVRLGFVKDTIKCYAASGKINGSVSRGGDDVGVIDVKIASSGGGSVSIIGVNAAEMKPFSIAETHAVTDRVTLKVAAIIGGTLTCDPTEEMTVTCA